MATYLEGGRFMNWLRRQFDSALERSRVRAGAQYATQMQQQIEEQLKQHWQQRLINAVETTQKNMHAAYNNDFTRMRTELEEFRRKEKKQLPEPWLYDRPMKSGDHIQDNNGNRFIVLSQAYLDKLNESKASQSTKTRAPRVRTNRKPRKSRRV